MTTLGYADLVSVNVYHQKAQLSGFKGLKVNLKVRQSIGLLNAYKPMYFDRNISENKDGKKMRAVIGLV